MIDRRTRTTRSPAAQNTDSTLGFRTSRILPQKADVGSVSLSPDGRYIAICDSEGFLDVYSLVNGRHLLDVSTTLRPLDYEGVQHYCWAQPYVQPFNIGLICVYHGGEIQLSEYRGPRSDGAWWTVSDPIHAHSTDVTSMCIDKTNNFVCTVAEDAMRLWQVDDNWTLKLVAMEQHDFDINGRLLQGAFFCGSLLYLPIGPKLVLSRSRCWETRERIFDRCKDISTLYDIAETFVSPDEKWMIGLDPGGGGHLYSTPELEHCTIVLGLNEKVKSVSFVEDSEAFVFGDPAGYIRIRSWGTSETLGSLSHHTRKAVAGAVHSRTIDGITTIASGTSRSTLFDEATVKIWTNATLTPPDSYVPILRSRNHHNNLLFGASLRSGEACRTR
ncbi:hypothetical protein SISNIDRAFT_468364 [Sistotremastrum niveocremeum HHB9708]|uniref:WD40 repeat-like protein n=1 Tax=Sistotremastrum niveocremeum HHB9708 TaxID=1314777 RepID=A0A164RIA5_9AGAM|nr:hypothetical protein SISNIDRAFT_468364 [Sistotremastrum niveocremeum HHB9708]